MNTATIANIRTIGDRHDRWQVRIWSKAYGLQGAGTGDDRVLKGERTFERQLDAAVAWATSWITSPRPLDHITIEGMPSREALAAYSRGNPVVRNMESDLAAYKAQRDELAWAVRELLVFTPNGPMRDRAEALLSQIEGA
jgi:hypothetical protein